MPQANLKGKTDMPAPQYPPLPDNYQNLCRLCREGRLFEVQRWFLANRYHPPDKVHHANWPMGIAIEKGFHSLVEVLLQHGIPADCSALSLAVRRRNLGMVELLFKYGATLDLVSFHAVVATSHRNIILFFIERGADIHTGYPIAQGLIRQTRLFLGIYKSLIEKHPELQFQADIALRHFCKQGSLRGVALLLWLGANPRAKVPGDVDEKEEFWETPLMSAAWAGSPDVLRLLKPTPATDDINALFHHGLHCLNLELIRYWLSLGADLNCVDESGQSSHCSVLFHLDWKLEFKRSWGTGLGTYDAISFLLEWFSLGARWAPQNEELKIARKVLLQLSPFENHKLIKLLLAQQVMSEGEVTHLLDTPKLRKHLEVRREAIVKLLPRLQKWLR